MGKDTKDRVDVNDISTWTKHKQRLCEKCRANCCTMPVEVKLGDLIRMEVITSFEAGEPIKRQGRSAVAIFSIQSGINAWSARFSETPIVPFAGVGLEGGSTGHPPAPSSTAAQKSG